MKTIQAVPVTHEAFRPYGYIANIADPSGEYAMSETLPAFHRDMVLAPMALMLVKQLRDGGYIRLWR